MFIEVTEQVNSFSIALGEKCRPLVTFRKMHVELVSSLATEEFLGEPHSTTKKDHDSCSWINKDIHKSALFTDFIHKADLTIQDEPFK